MTCYLGAVAVEAVLGVARRAARVDAHVKVGGLAAKSGRQVDAVGVGKVALGEDDAVERLVELDKHLHQILLALDVQRDDSGHVLHGCRPRLGRSHRLGG